MLLIPIQFLINSLNFSIILVASLNISGTAEKPGRSRGFEPYAGRGERPGRSERIPRQRAKSGRRTGRAKQAAGVARKAGEADSYLLDFPLLNFSFFRDC